MVLRDDKSYPFIHLTEHPYPRLTFHRGAKKKEGRYFGPFPSAAAVRDSLNILQKLFGVRPCEDGFFKNRSRPCLQHQIKRCSAPCVGLIDRDRYAEDARLAVLFLEGKSAAVLDEFKAKMEAAAADLEFERAARHRDQISHLRRIQENQYVHGQAGDVDIFGVAVGSGHACVQGLFVRDGRLLGHRTWFPKNELAVAESELLFAFLSQYYLGGDDREVPKTVVAATHLAEPALLAAALTERAAPQDRGGLPGAQPTGSLGHHGGGKRRVVPSGADRGPQERAGAVSWTCRPRWAGRMCLGAWSASTSATPPAKRPWRPAWYSTPPAR